MIKSVTFHAETPGPRLLVLGGVHGNETCGVEGCKRAIAEIENGKSELLRGRITLIPVCNPRAYEQGVRYVERNLNRNLVPINPPDCYEAELGNILCPILADCDYLVDIHSTTADGPPCMFADKELAFASSLGGEAVISNWAKAFSGVARADSSEPETWGIGTPQYAESQGAKTGVTLECGQHKNPQAPEIAYQGILRALGYLEMIAAPRVSAAKPRHIVMRTVYYRTDDGGRFAKTWRHLDTAAAGELIATRGNGEELRAPPEGAVIVLPKADTDLHQEWFYLGVEAGMTA